MGKVINKGFAKSAEGGLLGGAIITGANLRRSSKTKSPEPEAEAPKAEEAVEEPLSNPKTSEE